MSQKITARSPQALTSTKAPVKNEAAKPAAKTQSVAQNTAAKLPQPAPQAKALVDANVNQSKATSQMDMVAGSVQVNKAADELLKFTTQMLAQSLEMHGQSSNAKAVLADTDKLLKSVGEPKGYYVDPQRGSMAALDDNYARQKKVMDRLSTVAAQLEKSNTPTGDSQMAMNMVSANGSVVAQAKYAVAFQKLYDQQGTEAVLKEAQTFFSKLPKRVDSQIESRGGSLEPLERADATAEALTQATKKLATTPPAE